MKFVDKLKNKIAESQTAKMQICMLGARGVGKTSVLTSMFFNLNAPSAGTNLMLVTSKKDNGFTATAINEKHDLLYNMFKNITSNTYLTESGIPGDFEEHTYMFQFGEIGKISRIDLNIRDYPGEYVQTHPDKVQEYIADSQVVIIAIDAPHLIENKGEFNEVKNRTSVITEFFKKTFESLEDDKLILFVPLKCEKYYNEGRMNELTQCVEEKYFNLIDFFKTCTAKRHIACAITPILTLGGVVFDSFAADEEGNIITLHDEEGDLPTPQYRFVSSTASYSPKYCEQPLCYLLSFVTKLYYRTKDNNEGFLQKLKNIFKLFPDNPSLLLEADRFAMKKVVNKDGYKIIMGDRKV